VREGQAKMSNRSKGQSFPHLQGKPLILRKSRTISSESSLINRLHAIFAERNFSRPFAIGGSAGAAPTVSGMRKRRIAHTGKLNLISDFMQYVVVRSALSPRLSRTAKRRGRPPAYCAGRTRLRSSKGRARAIWQRCKAFRGPRDPMSVRVL
jgi:hypothetical protein